MKKLFYYAAAMIAALSTSIPSAQALNDSATFNVIINVTAACTVVMTGADITLNYTAGGAAQNGSTTADVTCTNTLPYDLSLNGLVGAGNYGPITDGATGLDYTVAFNAAGTGGADVTGQTGTGAAVGITIGANITAGQMGTCTGNCNNGAGALQTVYVNY